MKRVIYMSTYASTLTDQGIKAIGRTSARNNEALGITGVLVSVGGHFFQIIEGEDEAVNQLFEMISQDSRHTSILCLKTELNIPSRLFPDWSMNTINLDQHTDAILHPLKVLFQTVADTHRIIERYTQPSVLRIMASGINPLSVPIQKVERVILFADIVSFSFLSNHYPIEEVAQVVNDFLDLCTSSITALGGEVSKFMGDCVMAYFPPSHVDQALEASLTILESLRTLRHHAPSGSFRRLLYCGIGLSAGTVIEGNIGSTSKMDFTIIGDPVNTASRVESLTRQLQRALTFTEDVQRQARRTWKLVDVGKFDLKGKETITRVYSLDHELVIDFASHHDIKKSLDHSS